jgi:hypothetical protein
MSGTLPDLTIIYCNNFAGSLRSSLPPYFSRTPLSRCSVGALLNPRTHHATRLAPDHAIPTQVTPSTHIGNTLTSSGIRASCLNCRLVFLSTSLDNPLSHSVASPTRTRPQSQATLCSHYGRAAIPCSRLIRGLVRVREVM